MSTLARGMSPRTSSRARRRRRLRRRGIPGRSSSTEIIASRYSACSARRRELVGGGTIIKHMFESMELTATGESAALIELACDAALTEAQATGRRLKAIADLMHLRYREHGERTEWVADVWDAIAAELAAALRISRALASRYMSDAEVMRERLPKVGEILAVGDINYAMFNVIAHRTALITDEKALAAVDAEVALRAPRWPSLTRGRLAVRVDAIVLRGDQDAIRRTNKEIKDRYLNVSPPLSGIAEIYGSVFASTARALDRRLDELAGTVCEADPRTKAQRRADALT